MGETGDSRFELIHEFQAIPNNIEILSQIRSGHVKRVTDPDIRSLAIEILGSNVNTTFITTPINPQQMLGIRLPFLVLVVKNIKRYFIFEVQA